MKKPPHTYENTSKLVRLLIEWIQTLAEAPGWGDFKNKKMERTLFFDHPLYPEANDPLPDFEFDEQTNQDHTLVSKWFSLHSAIELMEQTQYYFRRYPFKGFPVTKTDHVRNIIEMYLGTVYITKIRMKNFLNLLNECYPDNKVDVGLVLKNFDKTFTYELKERNLVHHHDPFSDIALNRLNVTGLVMTGKSPMEGLWKLRHAQAYREICTHWQDRVKSGTHSAKLYLDIIAACVIDRATFLQHRGAHRPLETR